MQEILDDTHDQEDHGESQTSNGQNTQEGQAGIGRIEHGNQVGNGIRNPFTNGVENVENGIQDSSSSLQKHTFQS